MKPISYFINDVILQAGFGSAMMARQRETAWHQHQAASCDLSTEVKVRECGVWRCVEVGEHGGRGTWR